MKGGGGGRRGGGRERGGEIRIIYSFREGGGTDDLFI